MEKTESKKILVAGAGISGIGAAHMLIDTGESVVLYDSNESLDRKKFLSTLDALTAVSPTKITAPELLFFIKNK